MAIDFDNPRARQVFFEVYEALPRGGPGSTAATLRALALAGPLPARPQVLDLGCGPGAQTLVLAEAIGDAEITAVELHRPFLDTLERNLQAGIGGRVNLRHGDMARLDLPPASIDLIWSEGAAYFIGLENALRTWRPLLKPGGALAFTEATWFRADPPAAVRRCWADEYPDLGDAAACLALLARCGYDVAGHFALPEETWWDNFYTPMEARLGVLRQRHAGDHLAGQVLEECRQEIELYRRYSDYYGYTFFIAHAR